MRRIQAFNKMPIAGIKSKRNKVIKVINKDEPFFYITKIMTFKNDDEFMWIQKEIGERLDVFKRINNTGILEIIQSGIVEIQVKQTQESYTVFLTMREIIGLPLTKILERENLAIDILMTKNIKQIIWSILALIVGGGGYSNLIITLDNIIFQEVGDSYKPALNFFSFIGVQLLKFKKDIQKDEYLEIAMFLDQKTLQTGEIDVFQFKARNFALIIISLLLKRNPIHYLFHSVQVEKYIDIQKARQYYKKFIGPRINQILAFKSLQNAFNLLKIPGLEEFVKSVLMFKPKESKQNKNKKENKDKDKKEKKENSTVTNWQDIHQILLQRQNQISKDDFSKIPKLLWEEQSEWVKKMLKTKGLGVSEKGYNIYMAFKISAHLECLLQYNDWKTMMKKLEYSYRTNQMFYRLLKCTTLNNSTVLQKTIQQLLEITHESFKVFGKIQDRQIITQSYQGAFLNDYLRYC